MSMGGNTNIERYGVEAVFDNQEFEKNIKTTMNSLDDFEKALQLEGSSKGIEDLQKSFISLSDKIDPIADSVSALEKRFSGFGTAAGRVIENLVDRAVKAGEKMIRALTVDNIQAGWNKFAEDTKNIGTIISQGYSMAETEREMERLLFFTDETSYAYTDMVNNISKFTAAGQSLHDAVEEMQGIALWAGSAGVNAQKASQAMYQLSQAMGAGYMRKEDWKSMQTYNMDTKQFRQTALDTAVAMGKLKKTADGMYQSVANPKAGTFNINQFAEHLTQDKWFDSDVMKAVYSRYSEAVNQIYEYVQKNGVTATEAIKELEGTIDPLALQWFKASQEARTFGDAVEYVKEAVSTGWLKTFKLIFGNYEQATELWTNFSEVLYTLFVEMGEVRNGILSFWNAFGGREYLLLAIEQAFAAIGDIIGSVKEGFEKVFPPIEKWDAAGKVLFDLTKTFEEFAFSLRLDTETMNAFSDIGEAVASVFKLIITAIKTLLDVLKPLAPLVKDIASFLLELVAAVARGITTFTNWITTSEKTAHAVELIGHAARITILAFAGFKTVTAIINTFKAAILTASVVMTSMPTKLLGAVGAIKGGLAAIAGFLPIIAGIGAVVGAVVLANKWVVSSFGSWTNAINIARGKITEFINSLKPFKDSVVGAIGNIPQLFQNAKQAVGSFVTSFIQSFNFTAALESAKQKLSAFVQSISSLGKINFSTVKNGIGRGLSTVVSQFKKLPSLIQKATTKAKGFFNVRDKQSGFSKAIEGVSGAFDKFKGVLGNLGTHIAGIFNKIVAAFKSIKSFDDLKNKVASLISSFKGIDTVKNLIANFGDLLSNLGNKISPQFGKLGEVVGGAFINIGNFFKDFTSKIDISGALSNVGKVFQTFGLLIVGAISKVLPFLKIGGDSLRGFSESTRTNAGEALKAAGLIQTFCNQISTSIAALRTATEDNGGLVNSFFEFLANIVNKFKGGAINFLDQIGLLPYLQKAVQFIKPFIEYFGKLEPAQYLVLAFGLSVTKMAANTSKSIIKVTDSFTKLLDTVRSIPVTINNALTKISEELTKAVVNLNKVPEAIVAGFKELKKAILRHNLAKDFLRVALGISALALSLGLLAKFVDPAALYATAGAIVVFGIAISLLLSYLAGIETKGAGLLKKAAVIVSLAVAISIIAAAATALSKVPVDQFGLGMAMIAVIAYGMMKALERLNMVQAINVGSIVGLFLGLAVAFNLISVGIIALLGAMSIASPEAIGGVLLTITLFIGGIGFILAAASTIKPSAAFAILPILGIVMSLYLLVGAIILIANAPISFDLIKQNLEKFVLVIGALAVIILAATRLTATLSGFGMAIIGISVALGWLAKVMDRISQVHFKNLAHFIGGIIIFFALLKGLGSIFVIAEGLSKTALRGALGMVVLTFALRLMVTSLDALRAVIEKAGSFKIIFITWIFTILVGLLSLLAYVTKFTAYAKTKPILALIAALGLMVVAITLISMLPWPQIGKMAVVAVGLAVLFAAIGKAFAQIADATTKCDIKTMAIFGFVVAAIVGALVFLSLQPWEKVLSAGAAIFLAAIGIGVAFGVIGEAVKAAKDAWKGAIVIMAVALALIPAAYALSMLATFDPIPVLAAAGALGLVLVAMAGAARLAGDALKGALVLDIVIPALYVAAYSLSMLKGVDPTGVIAASAAIGIVLIAMAAASWMAQAAIVGAATLDLVIPAVIAAAISLQMLTAFEGNAAIKAAAAIGIVMVAMAGAAFIASLAITGALALDIAIPALVAAAGSLAVLAQFPTEAVTNAANALIKVLLGLAGAGLIAGLPLVSAGLITLSIAAMILSVALLNVGNAAMLFANAMTIIMANLMLLSTMSTEQVSVIGSNLSALGYAIGSAFASVIEGFFTTILSFIDRVTNGAVTAISNGLNYIIGLGAQFIDVGRNLITGLINGIQNIAPNLVAAVTNLGKSIIDTIKSVLGVHSPSIEFMNIMMDFVLGGGIGLENGTPGLLGAADTMGGSVLDRVSSIFSYENAASIMGTFVNGLMSTLSSGIAAAKSMLQDAGLTAAAALGDVDAQTKLARKKMMKANEKDEKEAQREREKKDKEDRAARKAMMEANAKDEAEEAEERRKKQQEEEMKKMFDTDAPGGGGGGGGGGGDGSDKAEKKEEKKIDQFTKIMDYARDAVDLFRHSYASAKTELSDTQQYQASKNAVELLALELYEQSIASETAEEAAERMGKTQAEVAADIKKAYLDMQKGIEDTLKSQLNMYEKFESKSALKGGDLASNIQTNHDALIAWDNELKRFSKRLEGVEGGLQIYNDLVSKGLDSMPQIKGWLDMTDEEFEKSIKNMNDIPKDIRFVGAHAMSGAANIAYSLADGFSEVLNTEEGAETGGIYGNAVLDGLRQSLLGGGNLQGEAAPVKAVAEEVAATMKEALDPNSSDAKASQSAASELGENVTEAVDSTVSNGKPEEIGKNLVEGIAKGIRDNASIAIIAAVEMATASLEAAKNALGIASPSKAFMELGYYSDEGLAQGFSKYGTVVREAAAESALGAINEMSGVFGRIADLIDGTIDLDPTIRPVLDLTNLQYGASQIGSLLGLNDPYALNAVGTISGIQNDAQLMAGLTSSLTDAINGMKTDNELPPVTINIYPTENQSAEEIADVVSWKLNHDVLKRRAVYGGAR